jgi:hypothetical protein
MVPWMPDSFQVKVLSLFEEKLEDILSKDEIRYFEGAANEIKFHRRLIQNLVDFFPVQEENLLSSTSKKVTQRSSREIALLCAEYATEEKSSERAGTFTQSTSSSPLGNNNSLSSSQMIAAIKSPVFSSASRIQETTPNPAANENESPAKRLRQGL